MLHLIGPKKPKYTVRFKLKVVKTMVLERLSCNEAKLVFKISADSANRWFQKFRGLYE